MVANVYTTKIANHITRRSIGAQLSLCVVISEITLNETINFIMFLTRNKSIKIYNFNKTYDTKFYYNNIVQYMKCNFNRVIFE